MDNRIRRTGRRPALVTIGMPVRDCQKTVGQAVHSLLLQTFSDWQLIVIDDGSSDETTKIVKQFQDKRITVFSDGQQFGLPARLNQIIRAARSTYFARMDGDDVAYPQRLERQVRYLEEHPEIDLVGCAMLVFGSCGRAIGMRIAPEQHARICQKPYAGFGLAHPTFLGRLEWFRRFGYRESAIRCEDQDLLLRSYRSSRFANVPEILMGYREDGICFDKIHIARWSYLRSVRREFASRGQYGIVAFAAVLQALKSIVDYVAAATVLDHRLLRHRARPIAADDGLTWQQVWARVNDF